MCEPLHERIKKELKKKHEVWNQHNGAWVQVSCPFCGDSPNPKTKHLNIRLTGDNLFVIKCFQPKCDVGGFLNKKRLHRLGITDTKIISEVQKLYNRNKGMVHTYTSELMEGRTSSIQLNYDVPKVVKDYFKKRTNMILDVEYINKYRVVVNFRQFALDNPDIKKSSALSRIINREKEGKFYIGFLNATHTQLFVRSITDSEIKHVKIPIVEIPEYMRHEDYCINQNMSYIETNNVFIAEGVFDIINTNKHIGGGIHGVYIASATANGIPRILNKYADLLYKANFYFVSDSDVPMRFYKEMIKEKPYRFNKIAVIYNKAGKDVGDISEPIELERTDLK